MPDPILSAHAAASDTSTVLRTAFDTGAIILPHGDSVVVQNPVPGGLGRILQWGFNLPQWVHITMVLVGTVIAVVGGRLLWTNRVAILEWLRTRNRPWKIALGTVAGIAVIGAAGGGAYGFHYMEHENDFCLGCHVMNDSWVKFTESEHSKLECHDCHRQSQYANARQLVMWIAERPTEIPEHGKVPTVRCAECHIKPPGQDSAWKRVIATSGHRLHLMSSDTTLKDVQCVTCHGIEVHKFTPANETCGQAGCHDDTKTRIVLGKMAGQTSAHCTGCHEFAVPVAENISTDSTRTFLVPKTQQCFECHEMRKQLPDFDPTKDAHAGMCGACHNPHSQTTPEASWESCATAGCHTSPATETPFHRGIPERQLNDCASCHKAHTWEADGTACASCHGDLDALDQRRIRGGPQRADASHHDPVDVVAPRRSPHRTAGGDAVTAIARPIAFAVPSASVPWPGAAASAAGAPVLPAGVQGQAPPDDDRPFRHRTHRDVQCSACHSSQNKHGEVTVRTSADCQQCHHAEDKAVGCEGCHARRTLAAPVTRTSRIKLTVWKAPKERGQTFRHDEHRSAECTACHEKAPEYTVTRDCASCHAEHHEPERECRACHAGVQAMHERTVHQGCAASGCHTDAESAAMPTEREVCLMCHTDMATHKRGGACADCHRVQWTKTPEPVKAGEP